MRGILCAILCGLAAVTVMPAGTAAAADTDTDSPRILVTFADPGLRRGIVSGRPGPAYRRRASYVASAGVKKSAKRIASEFSLEPVREWPIRTLELYCLVYRVSGQARLDDLLTRLRERPEVESAQTLNSFETMGATRQQTVDPYSQLQHVIETLELSRAHRWSVGSGTNVTIIDTGVDLGHPDLKTQIADHRDFVGDDRQSFVGDAHGTAIAGVIAAASGNGVGMIGVAPATRLSVLKACWYERRRPRAICDSFTLAQALDHAIQARTDVINLSLGGPSDELLGRLVHAALRSGIAVVAAAPPGGTAGFPAQITGVLVVHSANAFQHGDIEALAAPGEEIIVPTPRGGFDYMSGSSLAAAHVSGIVALLLARRPALGNDQIVSLLTASRSAAGESVNACRALANLLQRSGCRTAAVAPQNGRLRMSP